MKTIEKDDPGVQSIEWKRRQLTIQLRANTRTPHSTVKNGDNGPEVWVLGQPDLATESNRTPAESLSALWLKGGYGSIASLSGYFVAIIADGQSVWIVGDLLGLFPIYYAQYGRMTIIASSSMSIARQEGCEKSLNPRAMVAHLLTMHECLCESLWDGVKRLPAGFVLKISGGSISLIRGSRIPTGDDGFGLPIEGLSGRVFRATEEAFSVYRGQEVAVLFSGGMDSRTIGGFLRAAMPNRVRAYTLGRPSDLEMRCARRAASRLGWPLERIDIDTSLFPVAAKRQLAEEGLANGFNDLSWWQLTEPTIWSERVLLTGLLGDSVLGGSHMNWAYDQQQRRFSFAKMFERINQWGVSSSRLRKILRPQWHPLIDEVYEGLKEQFCALPGYDFQKAWAFDLINRQRYHVAGAAKRISNAIWPTFPLAHRRILEVAGNLPACAIMFRRLQKDLLIERFRDLAEIPFDNNTHRPRRLTGGLLSKSIDRSVGTAAAEFRRRFLHEQRYYYRVFDINNAGWRSVRKSVDTKGSLLSEYFVREELIDYLEHTDTEITTPHTIRDNSGRKTLIGICLLFRDEEPRLQHLH